MNPTTQNLGMLLAWFGASFDRFGFCFAKYKIPMVVYILSEMTVIWQYVNYVQPLTII